MKISKKLKYLIIIIFIIFVGLLCWFICSLQKTPPGFQRSLPAVLMTPIKEINWQPTYNTVGSFSAIEGITITSQVIARVKQIYFTSGQTVEKGQVLITLEDGDLLAQLQQKNAQLELDKLNYGRYKKLFSKNFISNAELDAMKSKYEESLANVLEIQEQLKYYSITAPFAGIVGLRNISSGELIQPSDVITHLQQFNPIYLNFSIPQQYINGSLVGKSIQAVMTIDGKDEKIVGKIISIDSQLDEASRTLVVRALVENKQNLIIPGMFAEVNMPLNALKKVLVVPTSAIVNTIYGCFIFKVVKNHQNGYSVVQVPTQEVDTIGSDTVINSQLLHVGDSVVSMGGFKLMNNEPISILETSSEG